MVAEAPPAPVPMAAPPPVIQAPAPVNVPPPAPQPRLRDRILEHIPIIGRLHQPGQ